MAFTLYHAYHTPLLRIDTIVVKDAGKGLSEVTATIVNERLTPTRSGQDRKYDIDPGRPGDDLRDQSTGQDDRNR